MLLMLDNYDSFTWNLVQYLGELGATVQGRAQRRDHARRRRGAESGAHRHLARSVHAHRGGHLRAADPALCRQDTDARRVPRPPGDRSGVRRHGSIRAQRVMHGKLSSIVHDQRGVFADVPSPFNATRYHSLAIERSSLPPVLDVTATADDGEIMARAASRAAGRRRPVPPRGDPDRARQARCLQNFLATTV